MRDSTPAAAPALATKPPAEPDLSALSPAACESNAAEALQRRWPRASKISFDRATRTFNQPTALVAELRGSGRAMPLPESPSTFFEYECAIDARDGQVLRTRIPGCAPVGGGVPRAARDRACCPGGGRHRTIELAR